MDFVGKRVKKEDKKEFIGRRVTKEVPGLGIQEGIVEGFDEERGCFMIRYEDEFAAVREFAKVPNANVGEEEEEGGSSSSVADQNRKRQRSVGDRGNDSRVICIASTSSSSSFGTGGFDLNVPFEGVEDLEDFNGGKRRRTGGFDLNVSVVSEDNDGESTGKLDSSRGIDLNLGGDDERNKSSDDQLSVRGLDGCTESMEVNVPPSDLAGDSSRHVASVMDLDANVMNERESPISYITDPNASAAEPTGCVIRRRRRLPESVPSAARTVLRRSARRGRTGISIQENAPSDTGLNAGENGFLLSEESAELNALPPMPQLPPSSEKLNLDGMPIFDLFSVYSFLRAFSCLLFLSPFGLGDFVASLRCNAPSLLFDYVHLCLLQILKGHLEYLADEGSESASICIRSLNWKYLDLITWPIFMVEYFLLHSSPSLSFDLRRWKLIKTDYYTLPASVKIEMLRCLCDDVIEAEIIRSELSTRALATDPMMEFDPKMVPARKGKAVIDVSGTSGSTSEAANETADWNADECRLCRTDGNLICCDGCPAAFHSRCVGVASDLLPEGDWFCPECIINKDNPWMRVGKSIRGAELLAIDPYGRRYYNSCGYLLVSNPSDMEFDIRYYHRDDLTKVIEAVKSSHVFFSTLTTAIRKFWNVSANINNDMGSRTASVPIDSTGNGIIPTMPFQPLSSLPLETIQGEIVVEERTGEKSLISACSVNMECEISEAVTVDKSTKICNPIASSEGSFEISPPITTVHSSQNARTSKRLSRISNGDDPSSSNSLEAEVGKNIQFADYDSVPANSRTNMAHSRGGTNYVNFYSFARTASLAAEALLRKTSDKILKDSRRSVEETISAQLKVFSDISTEFFWSNIRNIDVDARKERCGWCFSCKAPEHVGDCLFIIKDSGSSLDNFTSKSLGLHPKENWKGHLIDVMCHILSIEDRLHGLLLGPWLKPHYSKIWREAVYKSSDVGSLKRHLLMIESNLHTRALSAEWQRLVDNAPKVGSGSHIVTRSSRMPAKHVVNRRRSRHPDSEQNPSSNAATELGILWWRGGKISRELFKWKVLPLSLASKAARQAGRKRIPGVVYSEGSEFSKRSKFLAWRASVEASSSVEQLALQVRELDANIKWDAIENTQFLSQMDKEFWKSSRYFKKVIIRRMCTEGAVRKFLLDFGKRRYIPDIVVKHGSVVEESSSVRKKYWLEESYVPLHLFKAFEEKRIAREVNKTSSENLQDSGSMFKKPTKKTGFSYLFVKAERAEHYQCGFCKKDVLIRDAVTCQFCEGYFHKRHVKKSAGAIPTECTYLCQKCQDLTQAKNVPTKRKLTLQKGKKTSIVKSSAHSKIRTSAGKDKQITRKNSVAVPLRRSVRKVKPISREIDISGGLKRGKEPKKRESKKPNKSKNPKKPKKSEQATWKKKRTFICYPYWFNGLRLSTKPTEEKHMKFRSENLVVAFGDSNVITNKPRCCLCCEPEFSSALNYVSCEVCGDWFHGDAFGLEAKDVGNLIGFKCHKCRNRAPPICPQMHSARNDGGKLGRSSAAVIEHNKEVSISIALSNETLTRDEDAEHNPFSLEQRGEAIDDFKDQNRHLPDALMKSHVHENILSEDFSLELEDGRSTKFATPIEMERS